MTTGVLMYCFDTPETCYHRIADRSIDLVHQHLRVPVTVVTDRDTHAVWKRSDVNTIIVDPERTNTKLNKPWYNIERHRSYEHSPYDTTMVIDCDYFCFSDKLLRLSHSQQDFLVHKRSHDVTGPDLTDNDRNSVIDMVWATVLIFRKTARAKAVFDAVKMVKQNYQHFCNLYRVTYRNFRNDFAFAIALHQVYGFGQYDVIPDSIPAVMSHTQICAIDDRSVVLKHNDRQFSIQGCDLHFINKDVINV